MRELNKATINDQRGELEDAYEANESNFEDLSNKISDLADKLTEIQRTTSETYRLHTMIAAALGVRWKAR